jgi:hypothetical protein
VASTPKYVFYGNSVDIRNAKNAGYKDARFIDVSTYGEDSKFKDIMHANKTGANPVILGGAGAKGGISDALYKQLYGSGLKLERIGGADRYEVVDNLKKFMTPKAPTPQQQIDNKMGAIEKLLKGGSDSYYKNQEGALQSQRDAQMNELKKAYENAVSEGKISIDEAKSQFDKAVGELNKQYDSSKGTVMEQYEDTNETINEQAYNDSKRTEAVAQDRGIQNSAQMLGMEASDNARTNDYLTQNAESKNSAITGLTQQRDGQLSEYTSERDSRINSIKDRINAITKQKDLDLANVNNQYNAGLTQARGQADMMYNQALADLKAGDLNAFRQQQYALAQIDRQQAFDLEKMAKQYDYGKMMQDDQQSFQQGMQKMEQNFQMNSMLKQHQFDMSKLNATFTQDLQKMAKQFGFESQLSDKQFQQEWKIMQQDAQNAIAQEQKSYELARSRELSRYQKGTPEYEIREQQLKDARDAKIMDIHTQTMYDAQAQMHLSNMQKPTAPDISMWDKLWGKDDDKQSSYNSQLEAYKRAMEFFQTP